MANSTTIHRRKLGAGACRRACAGACRRAFVATMAFLAAGILPAAAQTALPFTFTVQEGKNITPTVNGSTLGVTAVAIGQTINFTLTGTYTGATTAVVSQPQLSGSTDFTVGALTPPAPATLAAGQSFTLPLSYTPSSTTPSTAELTLPVSIAAATSGGRLRRPR